MLTDVVEKEKFRSRKLETELKQKEEQLAEALKEKRDLQATEKKLKNNLDFQEKTMSDLVEKLEASVNDILSLEDRTRAQEAAVLRLKTQLEDVRHNKAAVEKQARQIESTYSTMVSKLRKNIEENEATIRKYEEDEARQHVLSRLPELDYQRSDLGIWFSSVGQEWTHKPDFEQLRDEHRKMHETAGCLIQAALQNEPEAIVLRFIEVLSEQSSRIAQFLHEIELDGLRNHYQL